MKLLTFGVRIALVTLACVLAGVATLPMFPSTEAPSLGSDLKSSGSINLGYGLGYGGYGGAGGLWGPGNGLCGGGGYRPYGYPSTYTFGGGGFYG